MKKTLLAISLFASLGMGFSAVAAPMDTGSATLQWAGSVPPATVHGAGYWIIKDGAVELNAGLLTFSSDGDAVALQSSSEIAFKVVKDENIASPVGGYLPAEDINGLAYNYEVMNLLVGVNGLTSNQPETGFFQINADGVKATVGTAATPKHKAAGEATRFTVVENDVTPPANITGVELEAGDQVVVMAIVAVTPESV